MCPQEDLAAVQPETQAQVSQIHRIPTRPDVVGSAPPVSQHCSEHQAADAQRHTQGPRQAVTPRRRRAGLDTRRLVYARLFFLVFPSLRSGPRSPLGPILPIVITTFAPLQNLPHVNRTIRQGMEERRQKVRVGREKRDAWSVSGCFFLQDSCGQSWIQEWWWCWWWWWGELWIAEGSSAGRNGKIKEMFSK